ncbi:predicted protein [Aspergillus terreus NIH2624]|uniref:Major facilitator superfamily (MFS) profile domain-containing protein n=1 Tax=Aspergillus terreus (strain NIH 2624 / FGSC A1156) TaxID=341663 RepID=Q0CZW3_ASPTN|nr:uncharacterized protein ATEG_00771 [Aspergillus terreus NIH2624]EAU39417.1 predicted protein [Aspergillus terreus NIH2624]
MSGVVGMLWAFATLAPTAMGIYTGGIVGVVSAQGMLRTTGGAGMRSILVAVAGFQAACSTSNPGIIGPTGVFARNVTSGEVPIPGSRLGLIGEADVGLDTDMDKKRRIDMMVFEISCC